MSLLASGLDYTGNVVEVMSEKRVSWRSFLSLMCQFERRVLCGAVRYGAARSGPVRCGAVRCGAVRCSG